VTAVLRQVAEAAGLTLTQGTDSGGAGGAVPRPGREGAHTAHLAELLAELQVVAREHPEATW
jgi:ring-1,2-phenylacetyl-CoA epoxidase subunit PaaC